MAIPPVDDREPSGRRRVLGAIVCIALASVAVYLALDAQRHEQEARRTVWEDILPRTEVSRPHVTRGKDSGTAFYAPPIPLSSAMLATGVFLEQQWTARLPVYSYDPALKMWRYR